MPEYTVVYGASDLGPKDNDILASIRVANPGGVGIYYRACPVCMETVVLCDNRPVDIPGLGLSWREHTHSSIEIPHLDMSPVRPAMLEGIRQRAGVSKLANVPATLTKDEIVWVVSYIDSLEERIKMISAGQAICKDNLQSLMDLNSQLRAELRDTVEELVILKKALIDAEAGDV